MYQIAVFVDAGYLYAQGSALLNGSKVSRQNIRLNVPLLLSDLTKAAIEVDGNARLLRIYWYDGLARGGMPSVDQRALTDSENVKCRYGIINSHGEQKGVDSLIVTDLIELARGQAISDALILSGDEDIRVGVQVAQSFGIRVHLLGIQPARGSQSPDLMAEADTRKEWMQATVGKWMLIAEQRAALPNSPVAPSEDWKAAAVNLAIGPMTMDAAQALMEFASQNRDQLPGDFDRPALAKARHILTRDLDPAERKAFRNELRSALRRLAVGEVSQTEV